MDNLSIYNSVRNVPETAKKPIIGGRLKGKTDINPMWRIKALTEQFGPCGIGWKYEITNKEIIPGAGGEVAAFVDINLYYRTPEREWSDAVPGTGGSMLVAKEKTGLYVSDECYKMALTDAISVACKALGFGADVYWDKDRTKYDARQDVTESSKPAHSTKNKPPQQDISEVIKAVVDAFGVVGKDLAEVEGYVGKPKSDWEQVDVEKLRAWYKELASK